jgi:hypothetical protein
LSIAIRILFKPDKLENMLLHKLYDSPFISTATVFAFGRQFVLKKRSDTTQTGVILGLLKT